MEGPPEDVPRPLLEHVVELLSRLRNVLIAFALATVICTIAPASLLSANPGLSLEEYKPLSVAVLQRMQEELLNMSGTVASGIARTLGVERVRIRLIALGWMDSLEVLLYVGALLGAVIVSPYAGYQIYAYLKPALYPEERRALLRISVGFSILFVLGCLYAYYVILPITFAFLAWIIAGTNVEMVFSVKDFFQFAFLGMVSTGLFFTMPLVTAGLAWAGLLRSETLRKRWREVFVGVLILTAIMTPDPTPVSMLLLSVPFMALYGLSYLLVKRVEPKRPPSP